MLVRSGGWHVSTGFDLKYGYTDMVLLVAELFESDANSPSSVSAASGKRAC